MTSVDFEAHEFEARAVSVGAIELDSAGWVIEATRYPALARAQQRLGLVPASLPRYTVNVLHQGAVFVLLQNGWQRLCDGRAVSARRAEVLAHVVALLYAQPEVKEVGVRG
jgi:hypothetical protein